MSNIHDNLSPRNHHSDDSSTPIPGPYRSLSAKRYRDPSHRKSVSFNDVPIVHEVPSYDTMRNSNSDIYRSWTFTETTSPISVLSPVLQPFNSTSAAAQKMHASRLSGLFYSSSPSLPSANRTSDWSTRTRTVKTIEESVDYSAPSIIIHRPDESTSKTSSHLEHTDERKSSYRSPLLPDSEHYRTLPFTYVPMSESTTTYTSMLANNLLTSNESTSNGTTRNVRARSATLPITVLNTTSSSPRNHESISITPLRATTNPTVSPNTSSRTVLKPATIAFHGSTGVQKPSPPPPPVPPPRSQSFTAHSRLMSSSTRPSSSSSNKRSTSTTIPSRTRSANITSTKRQITSPLDGSTSSGNQSTNLFTTKRNPNLKPTYTFSSSPMHHLLLPAHMN